MAPEADYQFGEGVQTTVKNLISAMIADAVDVEKPDLDRVLKEMERFVGGLPSLYRIGMSGIIKALEMAPMAMGYRHQFSNLPREDQVKVLVAFEASNNYLQRGMILSLKSIVLINYFSEPEMERALGYDHQCLVDARKAGKA
jgi:hypothetical protein